MNNETEYFVKQLMETSIKTKWRHPGNERMGIEYRVCVLCHGEWLADSPTRHKFPNNEFCPVAIVERAIELKTDFVVEFDRREHARS